MCTLPWSFCYYLSPISSYSLMPFAFTALGIESLGCGVESIALWLDGAMTGRLCVDENAKPLGGQSIRSPYLKFSMNRLGISTNKNRSHVQSSLRHCIDWLSTCLSRVLLLTHRRCWGKLGIQNHQFMPQLRKKRADHLLPQSCHRSLLVMKCSTFSRLQLTVIENLAADLL